jgi:hypothetical protein
MKAYTATIEHIYQNKDSFEGMLSGKLPPKLLSLLGLPTGGAYQEVRLEADLVAEWYQDVCMVMPEDGAIYAECADGRYRDIAHELEEMGILPFLQEKLDNEGQDWYAEYEEARLIRGYEIMRPMYDD